MAEQEEVPQDLKTWMARISGQLELSANKQDLEGLATKEDITKLKPKVRKLSNLEMS